ncbi:hypothetical protein LJR235_003564 [Pararhizobium sp. LjRoot235]|uniref:hypothetical protein n=1 Tax=Pararhizobium sp. LjRoot235 TaxID=3342291 RepID=UPI003ECEA324
MTNPPKIGPDVSRAASEAQKLAVLACLFAAYPSRAPNDFTLVRRAYLMSLEGTTEWGLFEAERAIYQGSLGHPYMPTPSELRREIDRLTKPHLERQRRAQMEQRRYAWPEELGAPHDDAARARIAEGFRKLRANFPAPARTQPLPRPPPDYSQERVEVSDALRQTLREKQS